MTDLIRRIFHGLASLISASASEPFTAASIFFGRAINVTTLHPPPLALLPYLFWIDTYIYWYRYGYIQILGVIAIVVVVVVVVGGAGVAVVNYFLFIFFLPAQIPPSDMKCSGVTEHWCGGCFCCWRCCRHRSRYGKGANNQQPPPAPPPPPPPPHDPLQMKPTRMCIHTYETNKKKHDKKR